MSARLEVPSVLARILGETRAEVDRRRASVPLEQLAEAPAPAPRSLLAALRAPGIAVIAEFKRRSPSAGPIGTGSDLRATIEAYQRGGARALSILTEEPNFGGSLADLREARASSGLPLLRKDFVVDVYQLHEARAAGADAVLLIVAALERAELASLYAQARALGLDVLVEVHDRRELDAALALEPQLVGVNNRDLRDFSVDLSRTAELLGEIPAHVTVVSESGIATAAQLQQLSGLGVAAVLVGESLMRSADPAAALAQLLEPTQF